jgi:dTDP-4-amino-4,6-dideoxygalactose transaminase
LSFGWDKPLQIGRGGAIILDDKESYQRLIEMRYDGRDLTQIPWQEQRVFRVGYHYRPTIEEAEAASEELKKIKITNPKPKYKQYPDLRTIEIVK